MIRVPTVDAFLVDGCGRCDRFKTPECKVHRWGRELVALRALVLESGLVEEVKWGFPCYALGGKNVVMIGAFNEHCALQFFRGSELVDDEGLLESPGPNSRHGRYLKVRSLEELEAKRASALALVEQAMALERAGKRVEVKAPADPLPLELERRLASDPALKAAFDALTPGRRRSHVLHIAGAKQAATRERRVEHGVAAILAGRGFNER